MMKKAILFLFVCISLLLSSYSAFNPDFEITSPVNDGPYIFFDNKKLKLIWIRNGKLKEKFITPGNFDEMNKTLNLYVSYNDLAKHNMPDPDYNQSYKDVEKVAVITDIHGEYKTYLNLLTGLGIIDKGQKWSYGKGHLVVLGDIFDRGDKVTEVLWHLFALEKQASQTGGKVHLILGNHELMTLNNELAYINKKYREVEKIINTGYSDLYSDNSVIGRWLRSKPVAVTINNMIFIHGGLSIKLVRKKISLNQINMVYSDLLSGNPMDYAESVQAEVLTSDDSDPLWYRGYFHDSAFCMTTVDSLLDFYGGKHIIVGHTAFQEVRALYDNKIIGADAGIMNKKSGEMLIVENGVFYRGFRDGRRIKL
jgi:hypothetical protein